MHPDRLAPLPAPTRRRVLPHLALAGLMALAGLLYVLVAMMWFVPDRRIECALGDSAGH